jgi:CRISPR-associated endonuclease/helicase Cas3
LAALSHYLERALEALPRREGRPFLEFAARRAEEHGVLVIEAPTGYGKSMISQAFALRSLCEGLKCIVAFPLRALLEDQLSKFRAMLSRLNYDERIIGARYMHHPESKYLLRPISLTTIDTLSLTLFGMAPEDLETALKYYDGTSTRSMGHYLFSRSMVLLSDLVLDEVHLLADMTKSLNFLVALIWIMASHGGRVALMSATIPRALEELLRAEGERIGLGFAKFSENPDEAFLEERRRKRYEVHLEGIRGDKFERILGWLKEGMRDGFRRSIVAFNTIPEAIEFYKMARERLALPRDGVLLLHSRFTEADRAMKGKRIRELGESDEYLIVATQVIEAGVDISSDLFISDLAPASSLIQRLGRFLRYKGEAEGRVHLWYEDWVEGKGRYKGVYDWGLIEGTRDFLEGRSSMNFHDPESYGPLLDYVYHEGSFSVSWKEIRELISITKVLRDPRWAIEAFMRLEGSFVREDALIPAIPSPSLTDGAPMSELMGHLVPMGLSTLSKLRPREELVVDEEDPGRALRKRLQNGFWDRGRERALRRALSSKFIAFVVEGSYDGDLGLVTKVEEGAELSKGRGQLDR